MAIHEPVEWLENRLKVLKSDRDQFLAQIKLANQRLAAIEVEQPLVEAAIAKLKS